MKNKSQVRRNSGKQLPASQDQTNTEDWFERIVKKRKPGKPGDTVSLIFFCQNEGMEITGVDLKPGEWQTIQKIASRNNEDVGSWLCRVVNQELAKADEPSKTQHKLNDFSVPETGENSSCLCIYDCHAKEPVSKVPLSAEQFLSMLMLPHKPGPFHGVEVERFIASAIQEKLSNAEHENAAITAQYGFSDDDIAAFVDYLDTTHIASVKISFFREAICNSMEHWKNSGLPTEAELNKLIHGFNLAFNEWAATAVEHAQQMNAAWSKFAPVLTGLINHALP